jgi:hypothetical protein
MSKKKVMIALAGFALGVALAVPAQAHPHDNGDNGDNGHNGDDNGHNGDNDNGKNGKDKDCRGDWDRVRVNRAACEKVARRIDRDGNDDNVVCEKRRYGSVRYRDNDRGKGN